MAEATLQDMSNDELFLLLNDKDPDALVNNTELSIVGSNLSLDQMPNEVLLEMYKAKQSDKTVQALKAPDLPTYLKNQVKLGLGDTLAFADTAAKALYAPFQYMLKNLYYGKGYEVEMDKERKMRSKLINFKNSDEYDTLIAEGRHDEIMQTIKSIQLEGGSRGLHWGDMIDAIGFPDIPFTEGATYFDTFIKNLTNSQEFVGKNITGADVHMRSPNDSYGENVLGMGVRFASDPSFYLSGGTGAAIKGGTLLSKSGVVGAHIFKNSTNAFFMGGATEVGAVAGAEIEERLTGEDTGTGRLVGSFAGGGFAIVPPIPLRFTAKKISELWKKRTYNKNHPDAVAEQYVTGSVKAIYQLMEGELTPEKFEALVKQFKIIGNTVDTGNIPLMVMAADSPTMQSQIKKLMQTDAVFRKQVEDEIYALAIGIDAKADAIFGTRYAPVELAEIPAQLRDQGERLIALRMELDQKIEALNLSFVPKNADDIGKQIKNIVEKRKVVAKEEMSPIYKKIDDEAKAAGVELPPSATTAIYDFITANNLQDLFGRRTPLDNMIKAYLKPKKSTEKVMVDQINLDGSTTKIERMRGDLPITHQDYLPPASMPLSWAQMDSLKRAINRFSRQDLNATEARKLAQFKTFFNEQRLKLIDGAEPSGLRFDNTKAMDLNNRLHEADVLFYEKIGIPYSAESILQINSRKYATEIYPVIFKNSESLNQFLNVSGTEGREIAGNAYILNMYDKVMKDGVFNANKVKILMRKDRRLLSQLPQVKSMLEKSIVDQSELMLKRDMINNSSNDFKAEVANHFLIESGLSPNYPTLAARLFKGDVSFYNKIQKDLKNVDSSTASIVNSNIRREYINQIFEQSKKSKDGAMRYILDPANSKMMELMFDKKHMETFKNLSRLSDQIKKIDIVALNNATTQNMVDPVAKIIPGVTTQYGASQIRDRVSSYGMKVIRILTHINEAKLAEKQAKGIQELLLHKDITKLNVWGNTYDWKITAGSFQALKNIVAELIPTYVHASIETTVLQEQKKENEERIRSGEIKRNQ